MADKISPRFRKTKTDKWAVMAPVEDLEKALAEGGKVDVQKKSGDWSTFVVGSLGKPFDVDGIQMCYGYAPEDDDGQAGGGPAGGGRQGATRRSSADAPPPDRGPDRDPWLTKADTGHADRDPSEPIPEYQGGPDDEWQGF